MPSCTKHGEWTDTLACPKCFIGGNPEKPKPKRGPSPTSRSLDWLRKQGYTCAVVEKRVPGTKAHVTQDLFGFIDILALRGSETMGVQTTTFTNMQARVKKIADSKHVGVVRAAQWTIHVHGWKGGERAPRVVDVS